MEIPLTTVINIAANHKYTHSFAPESINLQSIILQTIKLKLVNEKLWSTVSIACLLQLPKLIYVTLLFLSDNSVI